jgi:hypothetical protein
MGMGQILAGVGCGFALLLILWWSWKKSKEVEVKPVTPLPSYRALSDFELDQYIKTLVTGVVERFKENGNVILRIQHPDHNVTIASGSSHREALINLAEKLGAKK